MRSQSHILTLCLAMTLGLFCACRHGGNASEPSRLQTLDSALSRIDDIMRLQSINDSLQRTGDEAAMVLSLRQLGRLYRNNSRFREAIDTHNRGYELASRRHDTIEMVRALNNLGTDFRRMGVMEEATGYHYQALSCAERYSRADDSINLKNRVVALNGIGNIYMTIGNYAAADSVLRAALEGERKLESELGQAINLANIGAIKQHLGQTDSAWIYYRQSLALNQQAGSVIGVSLCHNHFGELYEQSGQLDRAISEYEQALDMMRRNSDTWHWLEVCLALARVHISRGETAKADHFISLGDSLALAIGSIEHQAQVLNLKHLQARHRGDYHSALDFYVRSDSLFDSVWQSGDNRQTQAMRINYERQRRQAELDLLYQNFETELRVKNIITVAAVIITLLAAMAIGFMLYTLRVRKRSELLRLQLEQMRNNFFTNITHEFRTPLTVIMGLSRQMMQSDRETGEDVREQAAIINRQGNNLLQLTNQLLDISRVQNEIGRPEWRTGNAVAFIGMIIESYHLLAERQGVGLRYAAQLERIEMDFPPYYMRHIVNNLLGNALKFTAAGGTIIATTALTDEHRLRLTVADTGCGIAPDELPHIFDTFYTGRAAKQGDLSTGVGLSLVHQVVMAMGGTITVQSDENKGTVFTVDLPTRHAPGAWPPIGEEDTEVDELAVEPSEHANTDMVADNDRPMILVVEDHDDVAFFIGQQLSRQFAVCYAHNGLEALQKAEQVMPDLIITDVMMPEVDGYELCRRVRQHSALNHIPIVMVTARCTDDDRIEGYEAGADAYLEKPFNADELRTRVVGLFEQRKQLRRHFMAQLGEERQTDDVSEQSERPQTKGAPPENAERATASERAFVKQWLARVDKALAEHRISLEQIASDLNMTSTQLRRKLLVVTGKTPLAFINDLRMERAAALLAGQPDLNISEIADRCGYDDLAYFSRQFKQHFGKTPTQYRLEVALEV